MPTYLFEKLVRDKVVSSMETYGLTVKSRPLTDDGEYSAALAKKLEEELNELSKAKSDEEELAELADVSEVRDELEKLGGRLYMPEIRHAAREMDVTMESLDIEWDDLMGARHLKIQKAGAFASRTFVDTVYVPEDDIATIQLYEEKGYQRIVAG